MKRTTLIGRMLMMLTAILCLSSCNLVWNVEEDMDVKQSIKFAGQWTGDFGMYYTYRQNGRLYTFDSYDTDIVFYPEYDGATYGYGKQVDYYERGPYEYIYNRFDWEIRNGIIKQNPYVNDSFNTTCQYCEYSQICGIFENIEERRPEIQGRDSAEKLWSKKISYAIIQLSNCKGA